MHGYSFLHLLFKPCSLNRVRQARNVKRKQSSYRAILKVKKARTRFRYLTAFTLIHRNTIILFILFYFVSGIYFLVKYFTECIFPG